MPALPFNVARDLAMGRRAERAGSDAGRAMVEPWAFVSGWEQLAGDLRRISCLLTCDAEADVLAHVLPRLSDTLTELGYPWEVAIVSAHADAGTRALLSAWTVLPGFRHLDANQCHYRNAACRGLCGAQGDVALVLCASEPRAIDRIPRAVRNWELGGEAVCVESTTGVSSSCSVGLAMQRQDRGDRLVLVDLRALDRACRHEAPGAPTANASIGRCRLLSDLEGSSNGSATLRAFP